MEAGRPRARASRLTTRPGRPAGYHAGPPCGGRWGQRGPHRKSRLLAARPCARALALSPHHLSRVFHASTGHTIARHRMRLRTRAALERLGRGETQPRPPGSRPWIRRSESPLPGAARRDGPEPVDASPRCRVDADGAAQQALRRLGHRSPASALRPRPRAGTAAFRPPGPWPQPGAPGRLTQ